MISFDFHDVMHDPGAPFDIQDRSGTDLTPQTLASVQYIFDSSTDDDNDMTSEHNTEKIPTGIDDHAIHELSFSDGTRVSESVMTNVPVLRSSELPTTTDEAGHALVCDTRGSQFAGLVGPFVTTPTLLRTPRLT